MKITWTIVVDADDELGISPHELDQLDELLEDLVAGNLIKLHGGWSIDSTHAVEI